MKQDKFAEELYLYMEDRIIEICEKFRKGNYNNASFPAFRIGSVADIETFLEENKLKIVKENEK